ncbi:MAG: CRISPR-associated endonuclease Cas1 [Clostridia bacterium]
MLQDNKLGLELVKEWIGQKLQNQKDFLKNLLMNRRDEGRQSILRNAIEKIQELQDKVKKVNAADIDEARYSLQVFEGSAGRVYLQLRLVKPM